MKKALILIIAMFYFPAFAGGGSGGGGGGLKQLAPDSPEKMIKELSSVFDSNYLGAKHLAKFAPKAEETSAEAVDLNDLSQVAMLFSNNENCTRAVAQKRILVKYKSYENSTLHLSIACESEKVSAKVSTDGISPEVEPLVMAAEASHNIDGKWVALGVL